MIATKYNKSSDVFFTADTHFGHTNIVGYTGRPFFKNKVSGDDIIAAREERKWYEVVDIKKHDETLIENWNKIVAPNDTVYHLGDFCYWRGNAKADIYLKQLNGKIILIKGNHDRGIENFRHLMNGYFDGGINTIQINNIKFVLSHYPMSSWNGSFYSMGGLGPNMLHGHIHSNGTYNLKPPFIKHPACCDVGVDAWNYRPAHVDEVLERIGKRIEFFMECYPRYRSE